MSMPEMLTNPTKVSGLDPTLFLDRADLQRHLRLGASTIDRLLATGKLPAADVRIGARIRLWSRKKIEDWRFTNDGEA